jgi:alpha-glucosidase
MAKLTKPRAKILRKPALALAAALSMLTSPTEAKPAKKPWWTHATIYEIYPRSFQDSNGDGIGDLNGITARLDYLKDLGIDAIWITPFFPSPNFDFGYDVADYTNVAPEYGTLADWDRLVAQAKRRGIRVMVDFVLNHSSSAHPWFKAALSSRDNPKRDWYVWHDPAPDGGPPTNWESIFGGSTWTLDAKSGQYYYHVFLPQQPDLNWRNPQLRKAMGDVMRFWLKRGAAGFRLDATPYLLEDPTWPQDRDVKSGAPVGLKPYNAGQSGNHAIMRDLRRIVDGFPGQRVLLGENAIATIGDLRRVYGAHNDEINLPMDFLYSGVQKLDAATFKARIDDAHGKLDGLPPVLFFSNHDTSRQATRLGDGVHNDQIARLTAAMTLTQPGTALIYYGEELGMQDLPADTLKAFPLGPKRQVADFRDAERSPMPWTGQAGTGQAETGRAGAGAGFTTGEPWLPLGDTANRNVAAQSQDPTSLLHWYKTLLHLRRTNPALRDGAYVPLASGNPKVLAFARQTRKGQGALVLLNMSDTAQQAHITGWQIPATVLLLASTPKPNPQQLEPYGVQILRYGPQ